MRRYQIKPRVFVEHPVATVRPGFRICELLDKFYEEGVAPDFLPADLGVDEVTELTPDGDFAVDPKGRIDIDLIDRLESDYVQGIKNIDEQSIPNE